MTNVFKALAHGAVASILVSSAAAQADNVAGCTITGFGFGNSNSSDVSVAVAAQVSAYICNNTDTTRADAEVLVTSEAIATATAEGIASVFATCVAQGNGEVMLNGRSLAQAEAFAIARSFVDAIVESNVCGFCETVADFVADSYEKIAVQAAAIAEVNVNTQADGDTVQIAAGGLAEAFVSASTTAFAQVLVAATADVNEGCTGRITGIVGALGDTCTVEVGATDDNIEENAETELIIDLIAEACDANEDVNVTVNATTTATATAMARAIANITASCMIEGDTTACVVSEANIQTTAEAVASAFAFAVVEARSTCDPPLCETSQVALTEAVEPILASAAADILFAQCATTGDTFSTSVLADEIMTATATSLSAVYARASVIGGVCDFALGIGGGAM